MVALGLGQTIVQGGMAVQFSPSAPGMLPQFGSAQDYLHFSQSKFYALDLSQRRVDFLQGDDGVAAPVRSRARPRTTGRWRWSAACTAATTTPSATT